MKKWGEVPVAFVHLRDGFEIESGALTAFCKEHMANFKCPKRFVFGPLPKTATGKIRKFELRRRLEEMSHGHVTG